MEFVIGSTRIEAGDNFDSGEVNADIKLMVRYLFKSGETVGTLQDSESMRVAEICLIFGGKV